MMGNNLSIAAAVGGGLFVAYCVYFDHKRRSDPLFKQKLKARREDAKSKAKARAQASTVYPDMSDFDAVQKFFIQEVQTGEDCIGQGSEEEGVEHLANAIAVCGQPQSLLQVFASTLPEEVFRKILEVLPAVTQKIRMLTMSRMAGLQMSMPPGDVFAAGEASEEAALRSLLSASDSSGGIPTGAGGSFGTIPSSASKSAVFIDDDVE